MFFIHVLMASLFALFLSFYHPYFTPLIAYASSRSNDLVLDRIDAMKSLVASPALGHFFYEELIVNLALQKNWEQVLNYTTGAVQSPIN